MTRLAKMLFVIVILAAVFAFIYPRLRSFFVRPGDVYLADPSKAVADARQLIQEYRATKKPDERGRMIEPQDLPQSLQIQPLKYAVVFSNHINLAMLRSPDGSLGARIWSADDASPHVDAIKIKSISESMA